MFEFVSLIVLFYCVFFALAIASFVIWIWLLIDCLKRNNYDSENDKIIWVLVIALVGVIGAIVYYFVIKRKKDPKKSAKQK